MRFFTRALAVGVTIAFGLTGTASAATHRSTHRSGGVSPMSTPAPTSTPAAAPDGSVAIPEGMRTTNGVRAKRYRGRDASGDRAYFARVPLKAPTQVQEAVIAGNQIVGLPYKWGGGHARAVDTGYDCSGTVSYALRGASLLKSPLDSSSFMHWGDRGLGEWITLYTNPSHIFAVIAGLRLDTSTAGDKSHLRGPQWRPRKRPTRGFHRVHPAGL